MSDGRPGSSAARRVLRPRTWRRWARMANFAGYDGASIDDATIGAGVRLSPTVSVRNGSRVTIGEGSHIGQGSCLWAGDSSGRITLGDHALLGPDVFITASNYDFDAGPGPVMDLPKREADVVIGANTWLGTRVVVLPGVTIGDGTIVAAGAVVTRDLPPDSVAAGVPAKVVRRRGAAT
ncbi:acyltransferase [Aeromicrobium choanae]|uniref:Hexapeptide repeat of succinyl-transferase n=1 Tax=Aeromicrobium choanae TaxID=1736691 RepID=A0A1T4YT36_9ACTN|nr:acyltransferase [Aeromicrobium choanae]SKB04994.1 Hexapeptide repeat of succinyl-transferase [Aeromicrobium choanae]